MTKVYLKLDENNSVEWYMREDDKPEQRIEFTMEELYSPEGKLGRIIKILEAGNAK